MVEPRGARLRAVATASARVDTGSQLTASENKAANGRAICPKVTTANAFLASSGTTGDQDHRAGLRTQRAFQRVQVRGLRVIQILDAVQSADQLAAVWRRGVAME